MKPLSKELREKMINFIAEYELDGLRDYSSEDLYWLARTGMRGIEEYTDLELLDWYVEHRQYSPCSCGMCYSCLQLGQVIDQAKKEIGL